MSWTPIVVNKMSIRHLMPKMICGFWKHVFRLQSRKICSYTHKEVFIIWTRRLFSKSKTNSDRHRYLRTNLVLFLMTSSCYKVWNGRISLPARVPILMVTNFSYQKWTVFFFSKIDLRLFIIIFMWLIIRFLQFSFRYLSMYVASSLRK